LKEIEIKLAQYREDLGDLMMGQLDVLTIAIYLDGFERNAYTKHRGLPVQIFAFAVAKGLCERNSAELTLIEKEAEKKRQPASVPPSTRSARSVHGCASSRVSSRNTSRR
jgi:enterobacteria phage integrase